MVLPGFTITEELYRGRARLVLRGLRERDSRRVILKTHPDGRRAEARAGLRHEYDILASLNGDAIVRALDFTQDPDRILLVLDDPGGVPLKSLIPPHGLDVTSFLRLAAPIAGALVELHRGGVIHKDLNPASILVDTGSGRVRLFDFSISTRLPSEPQQLTPPGMLEGTIAYMSPEQTGRMNRDLDYRTDLYSVGVTFYKMLSGVLPFDSADPLEVIHGHVARSPVPLRDLRPGVPPVLSAIVHKLLAKAPEDRYQSAFGLRADLDRCAAEWTATGAIEGITPGERDVGDRFVIPQRLYGREGEIAVLLQAYERACTGAAELMLVSGYSGIGKTSLIHEIYKSLTPSRGHFISGKFDQLVRDVPYSAIAQAFRGLIRQILTESEEAVGRWKEAILAALGANARVVTDVVPELTRLLGPQPPVPSLGARESQNRFQLVFQRLLSVLADPAHPLVIFLDDLQWADLPTLTLLEAVLGGRELRGLIVIGAFRDNEVSADHPLVKCLQGIDRAGVRVERIALGPLGMEPLTAFVADALRSSRDRTLDLTRLVQAKTAGNPFFVTQFLKSLHHEALIRFDHDGREWRYDLRMVEDRGMTDNVVELMAQKIRMLPDRAQQVLKLAACIGNRFDLRTLATISERSHEDAAAELWEAVEQGLVLRLKPEYAEPSPEGAPGVPDRIRYRFLHDRVQQAAYALIPEDSRPRMHLEVGRLLRWDLTDPERDERLFDVVNQLDYGADLLTDETERLDLAALNLAAGRKAKASTAYPPSLRYFETAARLLGPAAFASRYEPAFPLHLEIAEAQYLCGLFEQAEETFDRLLRHARTPLDRATVHRLRMIQYENLARYGDSVEAAREGLRLLGIDLPEEAELKRAALDRELTAIRERTASRSIASLAGLPEMTDEASRMAMRLLATVWSSAYILADTALVDLVAALLTRLSLEHGNTRESACGYVMYGITVGTRLGDYAAGDEFGRLALEVNDRFHDLGSRAKVWELYTCFVSPWRRPLQSCLPYLKEAVRAGVETGDLNYATYSAYVESWYGFLTSKDLSAFHREYAPTVSFLRRIRADSFADLEQVILNWGLCLQGLTAGPASLDTESFREGAFLDSYRGVPFFELFYHVVKLVLHYTFEEYGKARGVIERAEATVHSLSGTIWPALLTFYQSLTLAALYPGLAEGERAEVRARLDSNERRLRVWAENCPENFGPLHELTRAELARVTGANGEAVAAFEAAIDAAGRGGCLIWDALAKELYARFWMGRGQRSVASVYLRAAHDAYLEVGASAKAAQMSRRHADLFAPAAGGREAPDTGLAAGGETLVMTRAPAGALDGVSLMKAAEALVGEIDLGQLLQKLMTILLQNAGAQRGVLILEQDGAWLIQAEGSADPDQVTVLLAQPADASDRLPLAVVNYVRRTGESVVLEDARADETYRSDPYVRRFEPQSVLCAPVLHQGRLAGVLYLENNLMPGAFTPDRLQIVQLLSSHAATAIRNAELFREVSRLRDRLQAENVYLIEEIKTHHGFEDIIGESAALRRVLRQVEQVAPTDSTVLITGETGTGKELLARAIHGLSRRQDRPLVAVNCGAISPGLVESELFGHERGAFTGAVARKIGRFELADGGTIFLDEIGDLSPELQVKLLRVLQEGEFERVGGTKSLRVDVRVLAATHRDLNEEVKAGRFRSDLFYRLHVFPIQVPPLRERREDVPALVRCFLRQFATKLGRRIEVIPKDALDALSVYDWPGNIRELRNVIERSVIVSRSEALELGDWARMRPSGDATGAQARPLVEVEREHILDALERSNWKVSGPSGAARLLGLKPTTLEARMKKHSIRRPT